MGSIVNYRRFAITCYIIHLKDNKRYLLFHSNASRDPGLNKFGSATLATIGRDMHLVPGGEVAL
jgi:hypothetical protein